ncbi:uncharacterized protein M421DRAFT_61264 [Didymella exigua CBS 183.55]|uniref:Sister chromatid cohesion protein Ctf8 n=1 Tax=Didymella exigua CBS 183.55 TaxID=1150837 RepID=A0A6A5RLX6_9PLEO|nr:uncharacterized protein M421DRAFT_61264 [Didymella exigua CBS 183.55]KAF1929431.1 hypothetical protein M421DRAFT_61264 [Didymella exigua CBS 183.55]
MPSVPLYPPGQTPPPTIANPLPPLLHTPSGLALLEIQGTVHFPTPTSSATSTRVGKLVFPLYNPALHGAEDAKWMKRVYLYVGENQRMVGECKKLGKRFAVVRRRGSAEGEDTVMGGAEADGDARRGEELEIVEVVGHKLVFSGRPEPVGGGTEER